MKHSEENRKLFSKQKTKEKNPMWKGGLPKCIDCNKELISYTAKRCNPCSGKLKGGKKSRLWNGGKPNCIDCGIQINRFCKRCRPCTDIFRSKENHPNWKGGITPEHVKIRQSEEYKLWRISVFKRDNYICAKTKIKCKDIVAHHIKNFSSNKELRFDINNGITLSASAHIQFHSIYGNKNNTLEQLIEFLK